MTKEIIVDEKKEEKLKEENNQAKIQEKILTYRILQSRLEEIRKEGEIIERKYIENEATNQLIQDLKKGKTEKDILLPIGNGLFVKGKITDKKLFMDIGAGVISKRSISEAEGVVAQSRAEIESVVKKLNKEMSDTVQKLNELTMELQQLQKSAKA